MTLKSIYSSLRGAVRASLSRIVIRDYNEFCPGPPRRRALLSYAMLPLLPPRQLRDRERFSNRGCAQELARALNELGYQVDIVDCTNRSWRPDREYDLFVGHAGWNFTSIANALPKACPTIYFSTGVHWREHNRRAMQRHLDLAGRTGSMSASIREIKYEEDSAYERASGIMCLGNREARRTFAQYPTVVEINLGSFPIKWTGWRQKDYDAGRGHFLFFSGHGNIHKGLDVVLEAVLQTDCHLHICQRIEPEFDRYYGKALRAEPRIHLYGFIKQRSRQFHRLAERCNWIISATCAEGQPGSIIEGMAHGLIPVVPREANLDIGPWGIVLPSCDVAAIRDVISAASATPAAECSAKAEAVYKEVATRYSVEHFRQSVKNAVLTILRQ